MINSEAHSSVPIEPAQVWAGETPAHADASKLPGNRPLVIIATVVMVLCVAGSLWAYLSGLQEMHALAAQAANEPAGNAAQTISRMMVHANHWALELALAAVGGGAGLFIVAIVGGQSLRRNWAVRHIQTAEEADVRTQRLMGQLADARVSQEESLNDKASAEARLASFMQKHGALEKELEQRKQAEKTIAEQTHRLVRSNDALELHVQARTQDLQKLQRRNELILNSAADGICGFDLQGRATFVNPAAAKCTGWKIEELIGKTEDAVFFCPRGRDVAAMPNWLKNEQGEVLPEQVFHRKDGSTFAAEYVRKPIKENDKVVGTVVTFRDITERRLADDQLNRKAVELARSNRELEQFAFVASHDLQEPLRKIQAFGDRLKLKCETVQLEEGKDYLERMQSAAARMQTLINDLLTFSRVISSSQPLVAVDLNVVTKEVLGDLEHRIEKTGAQITVGKLPTVPADPTQMRQLLQNLIGNALKFQAAGQVPAIKIDAQIINRDQIRADAALPNQPANPQPDDKFCALTVQDNGIGFEEEYLEKIFAVFQRLHGRAEYEGTGVGLAVCRRITDRHGGLITARSKPGEGSTFFVILPLGPAQSEGSE